MIVGHVGVAFAARALDTREPAARTPLLWALAASVAPDALDFVYALGHYCNPDGVFSHSLPVVGIIATIFGVAAFLHTQSATTAFIVAALVCLHLPADYITGMKGLWPGGPVVGLYIYRWAWLDFLVEVPVIAAGWWLLRRAKFSPRWVVSGAALALLIAVQLSFNGSSAVNGPRPPRSCSR